MSDDKNIVRLIATLDSGDVILEHSDGQLEKVRSKTDWSRLRAMSEADIEQNAADDIDNPPLDEFFFRTMEPLSTPTKTRITMFVDDDVLDFFRRDGDRGYQTRMNAVLKRFVNAKR